MINYTELGQIRREVLRSTRTSRTSDLYFKAFEYGPHGELIAGKRILNVGSGDSNFDSNVGTVINIDPKYATQPPSYPEHNISGIAQRLPFLDGIFDETIAAFSLYWIKTGLDAALLEMIRVTKDGGKVKVHPAHTRQGFSFEHYPFVRIARVPTVPYLLTACDTTLVIEKDPKISSRDWIRVVNKVIESVGFKEGPPLDSKYK